MIEIDGATLEGGGQILRTSVALSAITGKPCRIFNIRAKRKNPGLQTQHLESVKATAKLCDAHVKGASIGSTQLEFIPKKIRSGNISINIPTAGSVGLVLQPLMIAALHADMEVRIKIKGGATNGKWAMPANYAKHVLLPLLGKIGYKAEMEILRYGYYPVGGAEVSLSIEPADLSPVNLTETGKIVSIKGISHAAKSLEKNSVAERQQKVARKMIFDELGIVPEIEVKYADSACPGSAIDLFATTENSFLGSEGLGERGKRAEDVGREAAEKLVKYIQSQSLLDEHAEDQLIPYMALAGKSRIKVFSISNHTRTNIWVTEKFLDVKFSTDEDSKIIECKKLIATS